MEIKVIVKTIRGKSIFVDTQVSDTIADFVEKLHKANYSYIYIESYLSKISYMHMGRILDHDKRLLDYQIGNMSTINEIPKSTFEKANKLLNFADN